MRAGTPLTTDQAASAVHGAEEAQPGRQRLTPLARLYLAAVYALAVAAAFATILADPAWPGLNALLAFVVLLPLTAGSQLCKVDAPNGHSYHATPALLLAAVLLLDPLLLVPLVVLAMLPEWLRYRYPWYIQAFNIATYLLNALAAWAVFHAIAGDDALAASWRSAAATALAAATFTVLNHALVALVLRVARGIGLKDSGILAWDSMATDATLLCVGAGMAAMWVVNPLLVVLAIAPLFLFYRALFVPQLQEEAHYDAKTGLLTPRRSLEVLNEEIARLEKSPRPAAVIMADLDLLRNINNSLGHLAGDEVLRAVADILRRSLPGEHIIGRFGGEEFILVLRGKDAAGGLAAAEKVRAAVEATSIPVTDSPDPVSVTISLGVAAFPDPCPDPQRLLYHADMAVYRSKLSGRNRVTLASPNSDDAGGATSYVETLESLVFALESRGAGFNGQTLRVTALALAMAREMGISEGSEGWSDIERGSLLHDVGKIAIPSRVLYKTGPLSEDEWEIVRQHPELGAAMLRSIEALAGAADIVRAHHEHYDGSGYPRGLRGRQIPRGARILAVADAFDAITSDRPYRGAQSEAVALEEIERGRGSHFDPKAVDALVRVLSPEPTAIVGEKPADRRNNRLPPSSLPQDAGTELEASTRV